MLLSTALGRSNCPGPSAGSGPFSCWLLSTDTAQERGHCPLCSSPRPVPCLPPGSPGISFLAICDCCLLPFGSAPLRRVWLHSLQNLQEVVETAAPCPPPHLAHLHQVAQAQCPPPPPIRQVLQPLCSAWASAIRDHHHLPCPWGHQMGTPTQMWLLQCQGKGTIRGVIRSQACGVGSGDG